MPSAGVSSDIRLGRQAISNGDTHSLTQRHGGAGRRNLVYRCARGPDALALPLPSLFQMLDLLGTDVAAFGHEHSGDVLAVTLRAVQLGNQIDREHALLSAELAGDALEIHILIEPTIKAERVDLQAGVDHRAYRRVSRGVEFLSQGQGTLVGLHEYRMSVARVKSQQVRDARQSPPLLPAIEDHIRCNIGVVHDLVSFLCNGSEGV